MTNFVQASAGLGELDLNYHRIPGSDPTLQRVAVKGRYGTYNLPALSALHAHSIIRNVQVQPQTSISSEAWSAKTIEFKLDNSSIHTLENLVFELNVNNATGGNITFNSSFDMIDKVEFLIGSQSLTSAPIPGTAFKQNLMFLSQEEFLRHQGNIQMSTSYGAGSALSNTSSATFLTPLLFSPFEQFGRAFFLPGCRQDVRIKITLAPATVALSSGSTATIVSVKLHAFGRELSPLDYEEQMKLWSTGAIDFRYLDCINQTAFTTETASTQNSFQLNSINGLVAFITIISRVANPTGSDYITYRTLTNLEVVDNAGANMHGGNALDGTFVTSVYSDFIGLPGQYQSALKAYVLSWSTNPVQALSYGVFNGGMPMKTTHRLRYVPAAGSATSCQMDCFAWVYRRLRINKGIVELVVSS